MFASTHASLITQDRSAKAKGCTSRCGGGKCLKLLFFHTILLLPVFRQSQCLHVGGGGRRQMMSLRDLAVLHFQVNLRSHNLSWNSSPHVAPFCNAFEAENRNRSGQLRRTRDRQASCHQDRKVCRARGTRTNSSAVRSPLTLDYGSVCSRVSDNFTSFLFPPLSFFQFRRRLVRS